MALQIVDPTTGYSKLPCAKCKRTVRFNIVDMLEEIPMEDATFNAEEEEIIMDLLSIHSKPGDFDFDQEELKMMREFDEKKKSGQHTQEQVAGKLLVDMTKCASCQRLFTSKRSRCGGCEKVAYCDSKCQRKHWKKEHKNVCKFLKTLSLGPQ